MKFYLKGTDFISFVTWYFTWIVIIAVNYEFENQRNYLIQNDIYQVLNKYMPPFLYQKAKGLHKHKI